MREEFWKLRFTRRDHLHVLAVDIRQVSAAAQRTSGTGKEEGEPLVIAFQGGSRWNEKDEAEYRPTGRNGYELASDRMAERAD
jgi:hypothetical protein